MYRVDCRRGFTKPLGDQGKAICGKQLRCEPDLSVFIRYFRFFRAQHFKIRYARFELIDGACEFRVGQSRIETKYFHTAIITMVEIWRDLFSVLRRERFAANFFNFARIFSRSLIFL